MLPAKWPHSTQLPRSATDTRRRILRIEVEAINSSYSVENRGIGAFRAFCFGFGFEFRFVLELVSVSVFVFVLDLGLDLDLLRFTF
jgi:hypothetical protein